MPHQYVTRLGWSQCLSVLLCACASTRGAGGSEDLAFDNSVSAACRNNPAHCAEQHKVALACAEERLRRLKPEGFSLSPRYRVDPVTGRAEYIQPEVVEELLRQGRRAELRGTIEPDIVIHDGQPQRVQGVYDFKFPCVNTDKKSPWRSYPQGHRFQTKNQGEVYLDALGVTPARVQPHVGVTR